MSRETALRILETGTTSEAQLKRAELYLYLDRTDVIRKEQKLPPALIHLLMYRDAGTETAWAPYEGFPSKKAAEDRWQDLTMSPGGHGYEFIIHPISYVD